MRNPSRLSWELIRHHHQPTISAHGYRRLREEPEADRVGDVAPRARAVRQGLGAIVRGGGGRGAPRARLHLCRGRVPGVHLCVWSRNAVCCVAAGRAERSWSARAHRDQDNNRNQRLHERHDRIKLRCTKGVGT